jgi:LacI family gluconate utilization system Gnt-I transcriptional repressor
MIVSSTAYSLAQEEQQVRTMLGWAPAAIVLTGRKHLPATQQLLLSAHQRGTPVVEIWDQSPSSESHLFQQIGFDHQRVGAQMARALIDRGYCHLVFMDSGVAEDFRAHERAHGFLAQAASLGLTAEHIHADLGDPVEQGGKCFASWHAQNESKPMLCGMGFANDVFATGALLEALRLKCRLPEEIGMLGFGDFPIGRYCQGGLSTMHIDGERIGQACAEYISKQLGTSDFSMAHTSSQIILQPRLLWRAC